MAGLGDRNNTCDHDWGPPAPGLWAELTLSEPRELGSSATPRSFLLLHTVSPYPLMARDSRLLLSPPRAVLPFGLAPWLPAHRKNMPTQLEPDFPSGPPMDSGSLFSPKETLRNLRLEAVLCRHFAALPTDGEAIGIGKG